MKTPYILSSSIIASFFFFFLFYNQQEESAIYVPIENKVVTNQNIILPIEVIGDEGTTNQRTFDLTASQASAAQKVWLMVNNLSYQNKGSIKINNEPWLQLNHNTAAVNPKELAYGGMVHGGFNTIRLTIPANGLREGSNTIQFRFDTSDAISIGYRVVKMNILNSSNTKLLPENTFTQDNPNTWTAPSGSSVSNGRNLWYNKNLWNHYDLNNGTGFWYGQSIPNRRTMRAKCTDCHTQDGRDLEMFSYSNNSIIERSKFHGLTEQEGKDIAAYIRSLSSNAKIGRYGRPWNPPYQPGPVLKNRPIEQWAAGAGLDWVLENDADMAPYIFPNGTSKEAIRSVFDSDKMEDRTILPLAIQFPDWKHWLPIVHPLDAYNKNNWFDNLSDTQNPIKSYEWVRNEFKNNYSVANIKSFNVAQKFRQLGKGVNTRSGFRHFYEIGTSDINHWRSKNGDANAHLNDGIDLEMAKTSMARLMAVKNFEIAVEFDLQDKAPLVVPDPEKDDPAVRQWPSNWYNVFEVPAHFTSDNSRHYKNQEQKTSHYETTVWYNLQFVLNGGNGFVGGTTPTDFNYHTPFIGFSNYYSGIDEPLRRFSAINQMYQIRTWSKSQNPGGQGFRIMNQGIWEMMGVSGSNQEFHSPFYDIVKQLDNIDAGLSNKVLEAMILQFLTEVEKHDLSTWPRDTNGGGNYKLDSANKTTAQLINIPHNGTPGNQRITERPADKLYDLIPIIQNNFNVHCSITNRLINWCKAAWPLIDFEKFRTNNCPDEACETPEIVHQGIYNIRTTHDKCINAIENNGFTITQQTCTSNDTSKWILENADTGYFYIKNIASGMYMTITGTNNGDAVQEAAFAGNDTQQWQINEANSCNFNIISKSANKCLDLKSGSSADGTHFQLWECVSNSSENREYSFEFLDQIVDPIVSIAKTTDATEGSNNITFTVSLDEGSNNTGSAITGTLTLTGTATAGTDYTNVSSFSIPNGANSTLVTIPITDDTEAENDETIIATIANPNIGVISANNSATAIITDNDCESTQIIDNGSYKITTKNDKCFSSTDFDGHTVTQQTCNDADDKKWILQDATSGFYFIKNKLTGNYLYATGITDGSLVEETPFTGNDDQQWKIVELPDCIFKIDAKTSNLSVDLRRGESYDGNWLQLYPYAAGGQENKQFSFEFLGMEEETSAISITKTTDAIEGSSNVTFTVSIDQGVNNTTGNPITGTVTLTGTATQGTDYSTITSFSIPNGENSTLITVPVLDDTDVEETETIIATISNPSTGSITGNTATATITDNDEATIYNISIEKVLDGTEGGFEAIFTVSLDPDVLNTSGNPITGTITFTGTATPGNDYDTITSFSIAEGENYTSIVLPITDDTLVEDTETIIATISNASIGTITTNIATATITDNDENPVYELSINKTSDATEGATDANFTVSIDSGNTNETGNEITGTVTLTGTAMQGSDYTNITSFSIPNGENQTQIIIPILDDNEIEDTETIIATISNPIEGTVSTNSSDTATITDDDKENATLSIQPLSGAIEGTSNASFSIVLNDNLINATQNNITGIITLTGDAQNGVDYTDVTSFSIQSGSNATEIIVPIIDDNLIENIEFIIATISQPSIGSLSIDTTSAVIEDDDKNNVTLSIETISDAIEGSTDAAFNIMLNNNLINATQNDITGTVSLSGTATKGIDYNDVTSFAIPNGENSIRINIPVLDDTEVEDTETIIATISNPSLGQISNNNDSATITDNDDDCSASQIIANGVYRITTKNDKCISSIDFDGHTVTQQTCNDGNDKKWILQDAGSGFYFIKNNLTSNYLYATGSTQGSLVEETPFTGNNNQQWKIEELPNCTSKINAKTSNLSIDLRRGESQDGNWLQLYEYIDDQNAVNKQFSFQFLGIEDDPVSISIEKTNDATEGESDATFVVRLDQGQNNTSGNPITGTVTLTGTATQGTDYSTITSFSIPNGENQTEITIPVLDDNEIEQTETIIATISNPSTGNISTTNIAEAAINDDDRQNATLSIQPISGAIEGTSNASFSIGLNDNLINSTQNDITGIITLTGDAQNDVDYTNVTSFSIPNGSNATEIIVPVIDDNLIENIEFIVATISQPSIGTLTIDTTSAIIEDDDKNNVTVSIQNISDAIEGSTDAAFNIMLNNDLINATQNDITGTVSLSGTATKGIDYNDVTSFAIPNGENSIRINIPVLDDTEVEDTETIIATISNPSIGETSNPNTASASITDNDTSTNCQNPVDIFAGYVYHITTRHDKYISAITSNGYTVTQQSNNENDSSKWVLENADAGYYFIKNLATARYMQTTGTNNGTHVEEANFSGNENQQWQINSTADCKFTIVSKSANKCLDLKSGSSADGTRFQIWNCDNPTNKENREYTFDLLGEVSNCDSPSIRNKSVYQIKTKHNKSIDGSGSGNIHQWNSHGKNNQKWILEDSGNGYYYIKNIRSYQCMTVQNTSTNGTNIEQNKCNDSENQRWKISLLDNCKFSVQSKATNKCLDLKNGQENNGTNIQQWSCMANNENQQFSFELLEEDKEFGLDNISVSDILVFPNPAYSTINVKIPSNDQGKSAEVRIYNFTGKLIKKETTQEDLVSMSLEDLPTGSYIVRVISNKQTYDKIILKQ